jgi:hypothetical protein
MYFFTLLPKKIGLQIRATLEYIDKLYTNQPDFCWYLKVSSSNYALIANINILYINYSETALAAKHLMMAQCG